MPRFILPFVLIALAATAPAAPVAPPPREAAHYFPTVVGTKWVRLLRIRAAKEIEVVQEVAAVEPGPAGPVVSVRVLYGGGKSDLLGRYELSDRGLFLRERLTGPPRPPERLLALPHRDFQSWAFEDPLRAGTTATARGPERVEVPAGAYDCIRVEYRADRGPPSTETRWYARGVGEVKAVTEFTQVVLKSFTPGPDRGP